MINYTKEANLLGHRTASATLQLDKLQLEDVIIYSLYLKWLKSMKSLEIRMISVKSNDFEISYTIFLSVGPLGT